MFKNIPITETIESHLNSSSDEVGEDNSYDESGKDEFLQFIVPKGKVSAEDVSLTMEADGDPATFSMTVNCLKSNDGSMIKLVKYTIGDASGSGDLNKGVASVLDAYDNEGVENAGYVTGASTISGTSQNNPDYTPVSD